jgi:hypothetical protein
MSTSSSSKTASAANRTYVDMTADLSTEGEGISTEEEGEKERKRGRRGLSSDE